MSVPPRSASKLRRVTSARTSTAKRRDQADDPSILNHEIQGPGKNSSAQRSNTISGKSW